MSSREGVEKGGCKRIEMIIKKFCQRYASDNFTRWVANNDVMQRFRKTISRWNWSANAFLWFDVRCNYSLN